MTIEEKFSKGIVVEPSEEYGYRLELWGASTKHPDSMFFFSDWEGKMDTKILEPKYQVMQWLLYCASTLTWPFHAKALAEFALENYANWNE